VVSTSGAVGLQWQAPSIGPLGYHIYRTQSTLDAMERITAEPVRQTWYVDTRVPMDVPCRYAVRSVSRRGLESEPSRAVEAMARVIREPVFVALFDPQARAQLESGQMLSGRVHGAARSADGVLDLRDGGHVTFPHDARFDLDQPISVECWARFDQPGSMPVLLSCGAWNQAGWFLQRLGNSWRWHIGGLDCDGGRPTENRWVHLVATWDGQTARLYENGRRVAQRTGRPNGARWSGELYIGQYSGQPGPPYQTSGQLKQVRIYHRPLDAAEAGAIGDASVQ
jgi:hypothetical protein